MLAIPLEGHLVGTIRYHHTVPGLKMRSKLLTVKNCEAERNLADRRPEKRGPVLVDWHQNLIRLTVSHNFRAV